MEVSIHQNLTAGVGIENMAYTSSYLALSLDNSSVLIYSLPESYPLLDSKLIQSLHIPSDPICIYWHFLDLIVGTSEGGLILYRRREDEWRNEISMSIHEMDIKGICGYIDTLITGGVDNFICSIEIESSSLRVLNRVRAHDGWVLGLSLKYPYCISQGTDNTTVIWKLPDLSKLFVLKHEFREIQESLVPVQKPFIDDQWASLSNVRSSINGESCALLVEIETWRLIEVPIMEFDGTITTESLKRKLPREFEKFISMSINTPAGLILASNGGLALLNTSDFTYKASYDFPDQLEVSSMLVLDRKTVLVSTLEGNIIRIDLYV